VGRGGAGWREGEEKEGYEGERTEERWVRRGGAGAEEKWESWKGRGREQGRGGGRGAREGERVRR